MYYLGLYNKNIDYDYRLPFFLKVCFAGFLGGFMGGMSVIIRLKLGNWFRCNSSNYINIDWG